MSFEPGTVIAGKYRVERLLGQGGMGVVLAARHLGLDEMVAVKLIREERAEGADALARFQREARAAARIKSEHVARVLDVDRLPEGDPYIVMELIDGTDLHALVKRRGPLAPDEAVTYITQACEGLAEAHALGMVHRDLKLKNLFLTKRRDGRALIKVIDFGVVKFSPIGDDDEPTHASGSASQLDRTKARDATLTGAAVLVGSVHYMAPEQIRASNVVDARADVWSLGVCLFTMLTGALPFDGETVAAVCAAIQGRPAPDVREIAPHVPPEIAGAVTRALEKDVRRRFANVAELASAIGPFGLDHAAAARIETILQSGSRRYELPAANIEPDAGSTMTSDAPAFMGRVESTIDAAAVGSLATHPAPTPRTARRIWWLTGAIAMVAAAASTVAIWAQPTLRPRVDPQATASPTTSSTTPIPAADPPAAAPIATSITDQDGAATSTIVTAPGAAAAGATETTAPSTTSLPATTRAPAKRTPRGPKTATTTTPAKTEPSSAYDRF